MRQCYHGNGYLSAAGAHDTITVGMKTMIHFVGIAGSGKGTQSKMLEKKYGWPRLGMGGLLREMAKEDTEQGNMIKRCIDNGELVPYQITVDAITETFFGTPDKIQMVDGFPRSPDQTEAYVSVMRKHDAQIIIVHFILSEEAAIQRLEERAKIEGRADDADPEKIKRRIEIYYELTEYAISSLRKHGTYIAVDANQPIEDIYRDIVKKLAKYVDLPHTA